MQIFAVTVMKRFWPILKWFFRVPSFQLAYGVNISILVAFIAWLFVDAQFWLVLRSIATCVGLDTYEWSRAFLRWDSLGPRGILFVALATVGIVAIAIVFGRLFVGRRSGKSVAAWMAAVALLASWLCLFITVDPNTGAEYRVRRDLERFQAVVAALEREHLSNRITLASGDVIRAAVSRKNEEFRVDHVSPLSRREAIAMGIRLVDDGCLFILQARRYTVEYHPAGMPAWQFDVRLRSVSPPLRLGNLIIVADLGEGWYLTQYEWDGN